MKPTTVWMKVLLVITVVAFAAMIGAQVQTTKTESTGTANHEVKVEHAEVVSVYGNDVILKMEDGSIRHVANVPETAHVTVDGREVGVHDLKPGMKLQKTVTTSTTPKVITTTQTVTGKVWHVQPPSSVILRLENGENQSFKVPKGQKFSINGQETDVWGLKKGMMVSATKVVEEPITVVTEKKILAGKLPPPAPPAPDAPILIASAAPMPAPTPAAEKAPEALPKTGSELPLLFSLGCLLLTGSGAMRLFRR
jgi:LPXTG-motif cell wall-anchored protein